MHLANQSAPLETTLQNLERRLGMLECELAANRRSAGRCRTLCAALAISLAGMGCLAASTIRDSLADVIQARRLEIVNADGKVVLAASATDTGGQLDVWTTKGRNVIRAGVNDQGGDFNLWSGAGTTLFSAFATPAGGEAGL